MDVHDVVIAGAGPAGLTAAIYAGRARLKTRVFEAMVPGGSAAITEEIENYPGVGTVGGSELVTKMVEQAEAFGANIETGNVTAVEVRDEAIVVTAGSQQCGARSLILATGTAYRKLGVPGEEELVGRGVSYCATCDGPLYKGLDIAVVGGGDAALQEALYLAGFARRLYLIHRRDDFRAVQVLRERVLAHEKITCMCSYVVERINGENTVESISLRRVETDEVTSLDVAGVFLFVGLEPRTGFLGGLVPRDERGFILTDEHMRTRVKGILAAGDCRSKPLRQITTAVGDGATAAVSAQRYIEHGEW
jgi:thioredoxin reductase (NADPH)